MKKYKIALDCMGFENDPKEAIKAAIDYNKKHPNVCFVLHGNKEIFEPYVDKLSDSFSYVHTTDVVVMTDTPISVRSKTNSSMYRAIEAVSKNEADAVLSAGSTAAYVALTYSLLNKIHPLIKPGFMSWVPTIDRKGFYFLDVGASKEFSGSELYYLGLIANEFVKATKKLANPRVGVLNIGTEENKGFKYHYDAHQLYKANNSINYIGFLEPRELIQGSCDILVSDGYSGNLVLKSLEGSIKAVGKILKRNYKINPLAALFSLNIIRSIYKTFDYKNNAGAVVLGLSKIALKTHGSADYKQFYSSIRLAHEMLDNDLIKILKEKTSFLDQ